MALTLKEAITATQTTIDVNGTDPLSNGDLYAIEDEQVFIVTASTGSVQPGQTAWQRLTVQRGQLGTTEAAHTAGTAVTLVQTPLGAGGEQTIVRIDATVAHDTVGLKTVGAVVGPAIAEGAIVLDALGELVTEFTTDTNQTMQLGVAPAVDTEAFLTMVTLNNVDSFPPESGSLKQVLPRTVGDPIQVLCGEESRLVVFLTTDNPGSVVAGEVRISFLIAEPAA